MAGFDLCITSPAAWPCHRAHLLCFALTLLCQAHKGAQGHLAGEVVFQIPIMWLSLKNNQESIFRHYQNGLRALGGLYCVCYALAMSASSGWLQGWSVIRTYHSTCGTVKFTNYSPGLSTPSGGPQHIFLHSSMSHFIELWKPLLFTGGAHIHHGGNDHQPSEGE